MLANVSAHLTVRDARPDDVPAILDIYNEAVRNTTASYDHAEITLEVRQAWFAAKRAAGWPVLVSEHEGEVVGWATFGPFREKSGYALTAEHSVYVRHDQRGVGVGHALMTTLIERARAMKLHILLGVVDAENAGSIRFHEGFGFQVAGRLSQVGFKFGRWLDAVFLELRLDEREPPNAL